MKRSLVLLACAACDGGDGATADARADVILRPDATDDFDLDGILDAVDNCPRVINVNQGNEDGDKFGDACDPCPVVGDDNPVDGDSDGVADACDTLPILPGDFIRYFEGFHSDVPEGWEQTGTWTFAAGGSITTSSPAAALSVLATDRTRDTVWAAFTVDATDGAASAAVVDNKQVGATPAVACALTSVPELAVYSTADAAGATTTPYQMTVGKTYIVKLRRDMNAYTCSAAAGAESASVMKNVTLNHTPYLSGIATTNATVRVHWFMVVESL